ncbi:MAG: general secretion pathway protein GspB [Pseudomonadota bacterium]
MSYILDALQKAESERKLGAIPNVYAQQAVIYPWDVRVPLWRRPSAWAVLAVSAAILAGLAWRPPWQTKAAAGMAEVSSAAALPRSAPITTRPAPAPNAAIRPPVAAAITIPPPPPPKAPRTELARQRTEPPRAEKTREKKPAQLAESPRPPVNDIVVSEVAPAPMPPPMPLAERPVPTLRQLPANIQREIPALAIGGYIYASSPAERSMLINKKLLREGDQVAPGLMLETMMAREAVLNYRGYRYRIAYQ